MRLFICLFFLGVLTGCIHFPTAAEIDSADYGSYPENYQELVNQWIYERAKDPDSVKYNKWRSPQRTYNGQQNSGYRVCVDVNSKNSFGGYSGWKIFYFFIRNGQVVQGMEAIENDCNNPMRAR